MVSRASRASTHWHIRIVLFFFLFVLFLVSFFLGGGVFCFHFVFVLFFFCFFFQETAWSSVIINSPVHTIKFQ